MSVQIALAAHTSSPFFRMSNGANNYGGDGIRVVDTGANAHRAKGIHIELNNCFDNSGAGISIPAGIDATVRGNTARRNGRAGIEVRDAQSDLLQAMHLRPDTPPDVLANAIHALRQNPTSDEGQASRIVTGSGLSPWVAGQVSSLVDFLANVLSVANSPQGQMVLGRLMGG